MWWLLFMIGQYLWRRDLKTNKFDINAEGNQDAAQNKTGSMEHIEVSEEKTARN